MHNIRTNWLSRSLLKENCVGSCQFALPLEIAHNYLTLTLTWPMYSNSNGIHILSADMRKILACRRLVQLRFLSTCETRATWKLFTNLHSLHTFAIKLAAQLDSIYIHTTHTHTHTHIRMHTRVYLSAGSATYNYIDILHASLACKRGNNEISLWLHFQLHMWA